MRAILIVVVCLALAGCTGSLFEAGEKGYVSGDGSVVIVDPADREAPAEPVAGESLDDGEDLALEDLAGKVVVLPVWASWCAPCIAEAPMFAAAAEEHGGDDVAFLGLNSREDDVAAARGLVRTSGIPYDNIYDPDGLTMLALRGSLAPNSLPAVVFVDREGRVAAVVRGEIDRSTLDGVVEDLLAESAG